MAPVLDHPTRNQETPLAERPIMRVSPSRLSHPRRKNDKRGLSGVLTVALALVVGFFLLEITLRLLPIPGLAFENRTYNELIGAGYYPLSYQIYTNRRGDYVKRQINRWGYLDTDHQKGKSSGVLE